MICKTLEMNYLKVLKNLLFVTFITQTVIMENCFTNGVSNQV